MNLRKLAVGSAIAPLAWMFIFTDFRALAGQPEKAQAAQYVIESFLTNGKKAGALVLGMTTLDEAMRMHPEAPFKPYDGDVRQAEEDPSAPGGLPELKFVYNPWQTMYSLYFNEGKRLVMVSELKELGKLSEKDLLKEYPGIAETYRDRHTVEYRAQLGPCVSFIARVGAAKGWVEEVSYAYTCETP